MADENLEHACELSKEFSKDFNFVRVDFMIYQNKIYFAELTFIPYSGFHDFGKVWNKKLSNYLNLGRQ